MILVGYHNLAFIQGLPSSNIKKRANIYKIISKPIKEREDAYIGISFAVFFVLCFGFGLSIWYAVLV